MANLSDITIKQEKRLCKVHGELGYFHAFVQIANVIPPSLMVGGHPGGQVACCRGLVEFPEGNRYVDPSEVEFCDEEHDFLVKMGENQKPKQWVYGCYSIKRDKFSYCDQCGAKPDETGIALCPAYQKQKILAENVKGDITNAED